MNSYRINMCKGEVWTPKNVISCRILHILQMTNGFSVLINLFYLKLLELELDIK